MTIFTLYKLLRKKPTAKRLIDDGLDSPYEAEELASQCGPGTYELVVCHVEPRSGVHSSQRFYSRFQIAG